MKLGDTITLAGNQWTVRPFTAAEHQAWDELAEQHDLKGKAAAYQAAQAARAGTARQMLLQSQAKALQAKLDAFLDGGDLKPDLSVDQRAAAFELAAEMDLITDRINTVQTEHVASLLLLEEDLTQARETVALEFMHALLGEPGSLEEFSAALTAEETLLLDELVALGKLRAGLSARSRRETAMIEKYLSLRSGNDSASQLPRPDAPGKPGRPGRSKKSSSRSKAGASAPSKPPPQ